VGASLPPLSEPPHALIEPSALRAAKPATQSSTYTYSIPVVAGYAVDGNTDGKFLDGSTTHTNDEQGAWWLSRPSQLLHFSKKRTATKTPLLRFLYLKINTYNLNFCYDDYSYLCKGLTVYFLIIIFENEKHNKHTN
jgi:hypothetical protein